MARSSGLGTLAVFAIASTGCADDASGSFRAGEAESFSDPGGGGGGGDTGDGGGGGGDSDPGPGDSGEEEQEEEETSDCPDEPAHDSPYAPTASCEYMDWDLEADGHYLISQFGTSNDSTTWGGTTSCGWLQLHYDYWECVQDANTGDCLAGDWHIPWVQGNVDYDYEDAMAAVSASGGGDVDWPEIFYVAGAQRFNCGSVLRVTYPTNGKCIVVYAEDGGPTATYEGPDYGGRRILDSSPAVVEWLGVQNHGWGNSDLVYVEWGKDGDVPGQSCTPCANVAAAAGTESMRTIWDVEHLGLDCR